MKSVNKNILVLTYWSFNDPLIQSYTLPYIKIILSKLPSASKIHILCLEQELYQGDVLKTTQEIELLRKYGINVIRKKYVKFGLKAIFNWILLLVSLSKIILVRRIDYIHTWCTPPGVFGVLLAYIWNRKLILDSYEPHAESMVENLQWERSSMAYKILFYFEKLQTKMADSIIGTTQGMLDYAKNKYDYEIKNFFVKPACVNLDQFEYTEMRNEKLVEDLDFEDKIVMLYTGKFGGIYFDKEIFDFVKEAADYFGKKIFRALILSNISEDELNSYCKKVGIDRDLIVLRFVSHYEIQDYMNIADFAICPVKPIPTKRYCTPIKNGEYWAMGLPVVIPRNISDDSEIISKHEIGYVLNDMTKTEYKYALEQIDKLLNTENISSKIRSIAVKYRGLNIADKVYSKIYE